MKSTARELWQRARTFCCFIQALFLRRPAPLGTIQVHAQPCLAACLGWSRLQNQDVDDEVLSLARYAAVNYVEQIVMIVMMKQTVSG
jgi:hypothetical protein